MCTSAFSVVSDKIGYEKMRDQSRLPFVSFEGAAVLFVVPVVSDLSGLDSCFTFGNRTSIVLTSVLQNKDSVLFNSWTLGFLAPLYRMICKEEML